MSLDKIDSAIKLAKEKANLINSTQQITDNVEVPKNITQAKVMASKIKQLPLEKDPELLKKQIEAEYLRKKAETEELLLTKKDELLEDGKQKLIRMALAKLPSLPKLPVVDPKILQAVTLAKQLKDLYKQKRKLGKENLKKGKEAYTYPLKSEMEKLPKIPDLPLIVSQIQPK